MWSIAYASRSIRPTERNMYNYSSIKLEYLALKWAMAEQFWEYLLGQKFVVFTENNPLSHLASAKLGATEQHWEARLAAFDFEIKYRSAKSNRNADALLRRHPPDCSLVEGWLPVTAVSHAMQQAGGAEVSQVTQALISVLPSRSASDLWCFKTASDLWCFLA